MTKFIEGAGKFTGRNLGRPVLDQLRKRIECYDLKINGLENLEALKGRQFLLVANHLMPREAKTQQSQLSPDAFVLEMLVKKYNDQELKIVAKSDDGWWAENIYKYFQKHVGQPFGQGMHQGLGFLPVLKNPGSVNTDFFKIVEQVVAEGKNPILIFPEGHWYQDFSPEHKLASGAANIATRYHLPVLPAYIYGAVDWQPGTNVQVAFGQSFKADQLTKPQVTEEIRLRLTELQKAARAQVT